MQFLAAQQNKILRKVVPSKPRTIILNGKKNNTGETALIIDDSNSEGIFTGYDFAGRPSTATLMITEFNDYENAKEPEQKMLTKATKPKVQQKKIHAKNQVNTTKSKTSLNLKQNTIETKLTKIAPIRKESRALAKFKALAKKIKRSPIVRPIAQLKPKSRQLCSAKR